MFSVWRGAMNELVILLPSKDDPNVESARVLIEKKTKDVDARIYQFNPKINDFVDDEGRAFFSSIQGDSSAVLLALGDDSIAEIGRRGYEGLVVGTACTSNVNLEHSFTYYINPLCVIKKIYDELWNRGGVDFFCLTRQEGGGSIWARRCIDSIKDFNREQKQVECKVVTPDKLIPRSGQLYVYIPGYEGDEIITLISIAIEKFVDVDVCVILDPMFGMLKKDVQDKICNNPRVQQVWFVDVPNAIGVPKSSTSDVALGFVEEALILAKDILAKGGTSDVVRDIRTQMTRFGNIFFSETGETYHAARLVDARTREYVDRVSGERKTESALAFFLQRMDTVFSDESWFNVMRNVLSLFRMGFADCEIAFHESERISSEFVPGKKHFFSYSDESLLDIGKRIVSLMLQMKRPHVIQQSPYGIDLPDNGVFRIYQIDNENNIDTYKCDVEAKRRCAIILARDKTCASHLWQCHSKGVFDQNGESLIEDGGVVIQGDPLNSWAKLPEEKSNSYLYILPASAYNDNVHEIKDCCYAIVKARQKLSYLDVQVLVTLVSRVFFRLHDIVYKRRIKETSLKSAIGSIMSRNGSHNIGSHVLAALSHNVGTMPDDRLLYQYIQHRMDYIATATTDFPTWSGETKLVNGLIRRFLSQRHLLDHIAGSEGLHSFKFQDPNVSGKARREQTDTIKLHIRRKDEKGTIISDFITEDNETNGSSVVDKLKNDISVAMPGGVIGAHAFFTILENVIRNAAKHGWARQKDDKQNQDAKAENLDIYVDFILDDDGKSITVTIFDNISDVFSVFDCNKMTEQEKEWLDEYRDDLKGGKEEIGTKNKWGDIINFLAGKSNAASLPDAYQEQHKKLSARTPEELKDIADRLMGEVPSDGSIGNRLWLPLHYSQDIKLRQSFIDDAGTLRRENWGLAEMKISAGYLNRRSISDIGGITEGLPIVTPVCVVQQEIFKDRDNKEVGVWKNHLGYQFKIPRPREIAFVCDRAKISQAKIDQLQTLGIFVTPLPEEMKFFKPKNEGDNDWNYSYVVLPSFPEQENPHLPFRVLVKNKSGCKCPDMVPGAAFYDTIVAQLQSDESAETIAESLKKEVYRTWIDYWCKKRGFGAVDYSTRPPLRIMPTEESDSGRSNQGLVSNYEVWDFVFKEMFRSIVGDLLQKADAGEFLVAEDVYWYLAILAVMPKSLGENGSVFTFKDEDDALRAKINDDSNKTDHHERELIFRQLNQWFDEFQGLINDKDSRFELRPALQEFSSKYVLKFGRQNDSATNNTIDSESGIQCASVFNKEVMKAVENRHFNMDDNPLWGTADSDNGMICFLSELCSAYREADVMLRKYEERIVSLPAFLGESQTLSKKQGEETNTETIKRFEETLKDEKNGLGITLHYGITSANWSGRAIVFARHAKSDDYSHERMLYFEPLSGTQSYLYELMQLPQSDSSDQILTRMYETGLSHVLIIDERVSKFLRSRPDEIKTFCRMGIWCVDEKKFGVAKEVDNKEKIPPIEMLDSLIEFNKEKFDALIGAAVDEEAAVGENEFSQNDLICNEVRDRGKVKFDILIIHQGLIDKWLPQAETNSKRVESFIHVLRTIIPYVVITTGRGTPANTPDSARILPFPVLEATLFKKYPEKMVLVDTIMNILPLGAHK